MTDSKSIAACADSASAGAELDLKPVPSPCINVCRMTPDRSHCEGCFRTLDEIRAWSRADGGLRRGIWTQLLDRAGIPQPPAHAPETSP